MNWPCGHPRTPENTQRIGEAGERCRECRRRIAKNSWRERARQKAELRKPKLIPTDQPLTPEAHGSRRRLQAYARYYERHVAGVGR